MAAFQIGSLLRFTVQETEPKGSRIDSGAKRMKELERENAELKKMLADSLLKNRVLEAVNAKKW